MYYFYLIIIMELYLSSFVIFSNKESYKSQNLSLSFYKAYKFLVLLKHTSLLYCNKLSQIYIQSKLCQIIIN